MSKRFDFDVATEARRGFIGKLLKNAVQFTATVVLARLLGAEGYGTYAFLFTVVKSATIFTHGIGEALKKRVSESDTDVAQYIGAGILFQLIFVAASSVVGLVIIHFFPQHVPVDTQTAYVVLFAYHMWGLLDLSKELYAAVGEPAESLWLEPLVRALTLAIQVVFLWLGMGLFALMIGVLLAAIITAVCGFYLVGTLPAVPSKEVLYRTGEFAKWSLPGEMLGKAYGYSDSIAVYILLGPTAMAYFSTAGQIVLIGTVVGPALAQPLIVKTSNNHSLNLSVTDPLKTGITFAGILSLPILAFTIAIPELMPLLYGADFEGTGMVLILMAAYSAFGVYKSQFSAAFNGIDRPRVPTVVRLIQLVFYGPVMYLAATYYGLYGALLGSFFIEFLGFALLYLFARNHFDSFVDWRMIGGQISGSVAVFLAAYTVFTALSGSFVAFLAAIPVAAVAFVIGSALASHRFRAIYLSYVGIGGGPDVEE